MNPQKAALDAIVQRKVAQVRAITRGAESAGRTLTPDEKKTVEAAIRAAQVAKDESKAIDDVENKARQIDALVGGAPSADGKRSLYSAFKAAGWEPRTRTTIPFANLKTASFSGDVDDLSPGRREGAPLGYDVRTIADALPSEDIAEKQSSVQTFRQVSRTLPTPGDVQRALTATTEKSEVASQREMVELTVIQLAAKEENVSNFLLLQDGIRSMIDSDLRLALLAARDDAVLDAIAAANPPNTTDGANLFEAARFAIEELAQDGYLADTFVVSGDDAVSMDLATTSGPEAIYLSQLGQSAIIGTSAGAAGRGSGPWGLRRVVVPTLVAPLVFASQSFGRCYNGPLSLESFEENSGATNSQLIRLEQNFACGIERPDAVRELVLGS